MKMSIIIIWMNYIIITNKDIIQIRFPINPNKTSLQFYPKNKKRVQFDDEFDDNEYNNYNYKLYY